MSASAESQEVQVPHIGFVVNENPYCLWDVETYGERTLEFVRGIDPTYYDHIASIHGDLLEGDEKQYAATALRIAYTQGLETLFALIGAVVQAPYCIAGWVLKYTNKDLYELVKKINEQQPIITQLVNTKVTWQAIADLVFSNLRMGDEEKDKELRRCFANLWKRFAKDYLDDINIAEYNSLKHGSRAHMGPYHLAMGLEDTPGVPAPPERMETISASQFGSSFLVPVKLHDRRNFTVKTFRKNWQPQNMIYGLNFISMSIGNVLSFIKIFHKESVEKAPFSFPPDFDDFKKPWAEHGGMVVNWGARIDERDVTPLTEEEILKFYEDAKTE